MVNDLKGYYSYITNKLIIIKHAYTNELVIYNLKYKIKYKMN